MQWDFDRKREGYIDKKRIVVEIHKEIFSERLTESISDTKFTDQTSIISAITSKISKDNTLKIYIIQKEANRFVNLNNRKLSKYFKKWKVRLLKRWKELDLGDKDKLKNLYKYNLLNHDFKQLDPEATKPSIKEKYKQYE